MAQVVVDKDLQSDSPHIPWPLSGPSSFTAENEHSTTESASEIQEPPAIVAHRLSTSVILPGQPKALDGVALRAFCLGLSLGLNSLFAVSLALNQQLVWRAPFFIAVLSLFHFLEYYITASFNTQAANISAFLLSQNGKAYNIAHTTALLECIVRTVFFPRWQIASSKLLLIGFAAIFTGQVTRSLAMSQAGTNFNHTVQTRRVEGHELVTHGIYCIFRHPSYFGFFWWGLGTQIVLGNFICFSAYAFILWSFFRRRIQKEEEFLVAFFGSDYENYRSRTRVWIPFIR